MQNLVFGFSKVLAKLPLCVLHHLANGLGVLAFLFNCKLRQRITTHLRIADLPHHSSAVLCNIQETIKGGLELPIAFFRPTSHIPTLFTEIQGWQHIQTALDEGKALLLLTPHLGSYDLAGRYISERLPFPLTALYKPSKIALFNEMMQQGRTRGKGQTAPTNLHGVKQIIKALKNQQATIILPDHVPNPDEGDGVWANFFQQPAYTMTLASKLALMPRVATLFFCAERLANGKGFILHINPLQGTLTGDKIHDATVINQNIENWIKRFPHQYLFAYNRYKRPTGAPPAPIND